jgi:hypothetical protein
MLKFYIESTHLYATKISNSPEALLHLFILLSKSYYCIFFVNIINMWLRKFTNFYRKKTNAATSDQEVQMIRQLEQKYLSTIEEEISELDDSSEDDAQEQQDLKEEDKERIKRVIEYVSAKQESSKSHPPISYKNEQNPSNESKHLQTSSDSSQEEVEELFVNELLNLFQKSWFLNKNTEKDKNEALQQEPNVAEK